MTNQFMSMSLQLLIHMRCYHGAGIDDGITKRLRPVFQVCRDPVSFHTEGRISCRHTLDFAVNLPGINRQLTLRMNLRFRQRDTHQGDPVLIGQ